MANLKLEANYRSDMSKGRMNVVRRMGYVTGSVFGHDAEPVSIEVNLADLVDIIRHSDAGLRTLIELKVNGAPKKCDGTIIIKEFFRDPLSRKVLDVQFQRVSLKEKIHVGVPIELIGDAPGVKNGGVLEQMINELQINCLPGNIPPKVEVDVSGLEIGHLIRVADLTFDESIELVTDPDTLICNLKPPLVVHVEAAPAEEAAEAAPAARAETST